MSNTPARPRRTRRSIGLWGAPQSGKTTFLGALYLAVSHSPHDLRMRGENRETTEFLSDSFAALTGRRFPPGTEQMSALSLAMNMRTRETVVDRGKWGRPVTRVVPLSTEFNIDICDAPGAQFGSESPAVPATPAQDRLDLDDEDLPPVRQPVRIARPSPAGDVVDHLAKSRGLLLLIDPIRELQTGDAHLYFHPTLLKLAQLWGDGSRLPHYVAVCITKFDHPEVFEFAKNNGFAVPDDTPYRFPRVPEEAAEGFFRAFCAQSEVSQADLVRADLARYFYPERIRYFVTSAIGFHLGPDNEFRAQDYQNTVEQPDGTRRIRGRIHPVNVLEPVMWLGRLVSVVGAPRV